jgi:hypothetical protein
MMKIKVISIYISLVLLMVLSACEEVIILDLKDSEPRVIIEAALNASTRECVVVATKSIGFYEVESAGRIAGATVELFNGTGLPTRLKEISPGEYSAEDLVVSPGESFLITLTISDEEKYSASAKVPFPVYLDSLKIVRGFGDPRPNSPPIFLINPIWKDPAGIANYYRFKVTTNGKPQSGSFTITNDAPFDGTVVNLPLYRYSFALGDTVNVEFQSIDSISFSYFTQLNDMARPSFVSATPYNPIGNFTNNALGYFGIFYNQKWDAIVSAGK